MSALKGSNVLRAATLRNQILKAKHAYYYSNEPVLTDAEYDALEDELRLLAPDDPVLALVGSPVPSDTMLTKARHSIPMGSQSKVNSEDEFRAWCAKNEVQVIHVSLKGDGASAAAYYKSGLLVQAISRGDGVVGEDITANAMRFKGLPAWAGVQGVEFNGAVRFEVILTVEDWTKIDPSRSKNPRNAGTGIMGRKNGHQSNCLTVFAFDLDETRDGKSVEFGTESEKTARLVELGFNVIEHAIYKSADEAIAYFRQIAKARDLLPIWIDGVVMKVDDIPKQRDLGITAGRPKGQVAWKFDSSGAETVLEAVVVSGGHTGGLYPTAQLRPVEIGGTTVSNASLANYDEIQRLDVAIGDSVWVVKANDIIPKIIRVTQRPETRVAIPIPTICPFCGGEVGRRRITGGDEGVIIECRNAECPKKSTGKIRRWIASLDILGIGDVVLESMIKRFDLADAADLYTLRDRAEELAGLVTNAERELRLGEKRAASILDAIDTTRALLLSQFLGSLGLEHLGKRRVELMMKSADGLLDRLEDWRSGFLRDPAIAVKAGVPNIGGQIQDGIDAMSTVIDKLLAAGVTARPTSRDPSGETAPGFAPLMTICISGKLSSGKKKSDYEQPLLAAGYELVEDVAKGLNYLVLADPASTSSKLEKAKKLSVRVISEEQLIQMVTSVAQVQVVQKVHQIVEEIPMSKASAGFNFDGQFQRYEFVDEKSSKFWEVRVAGPTVDVRYGKIGTIGQSQTKEFGDDAAAQKYAEKMVGEKMKGSYREPSSAGARKPAAQALDVVANRANAAKAETATKTIPVPKSSEVHPHNTSGSKTLCISGKLPSGNKKTDYEAPLRVAGIELLDDVINGLSYLVLADPTSISAKAEKARKLGVEVISEDQLIALINQTSNVVLDAQIQNGIFPKELSQLRDLFETICKGVNAESRADLRDAYERSFSSGAWAWDPITKLVSDDQVDRLGEVVMGPIYTCPEFDWPQQSGYPMAPLIQLDLGKASKIGFVNLGDGLLQVWMPHKAVMGPDQMVRVVPRQYVNPDRLTPIVEIPDDMDPLQARDDVWDEDADDFVKAPAVQITGYAARRFTIQLKQTIQDGFKIKDLTSDKKVAEQIQEFDKLLKTMTKQGKTSWNPANCHLFGTFSPLQWEAKDRSSPIFCFESDEFGFMWGDSGNAQLFYEIREDGVVSFKFDWTCY